MRSPHAVLVLALVLSAAVAGRAQDAAAGAASPADQPQQTDVAAATEQTQPAAEQTPEQQPVDAAAKPAVEEVASSGDGAAEPAAEQTPEQQPVDAAAKPAVEEVASSGDVAAEQPQSQPDPAAVSGEAGSDGQPANSTRVFTAEQLAELQQQIQQAIDLQRQHKEVGEPLIAQLVAEAPAAELASGDADVSTTGACSAAYDIFCNTVQVGEGRFADCLTEQLHQEQLGNVPGVNISPTCIAELEAFKIERSTNINKDVPLARACSRDAKRFCSKHGTDRGAVLSCLRTVSDQLSERCQAEVLRTQQDAAEDFHLDAKLDQYCKGDADKYCADVAPGEGRIQDCLRENVDKVSFECKEELFRQDVENAGDVQLSARLRRLCPNELSMFCQPLGETDYPTTLDCLEGNRNYNHFGPDCRAALETGMEARAMDFRLDAPLRQACEEDIQKLCKLPLERLDSVQGFDAKVLRCLQDFREDLTVPECQAQVHRTLERASEDVRFNYPLAHDCNEERQLLCPDAQPGSARVIQCLQDGRDQLGMYCSAALFDFEQDMAEDIDFKAPLKAACAGEISALCPDVKHGHARIIRCLQETMDDAAMGPECRDKVVADTERSSTDYRLNFRLRDACKEDLPTLCPGVCKDAIKHACGGRALRCLTESSNQIRSKACREEVFYFEKMEVFDYRNDVILAETCREDVNKFCKKVEIGEGRVHECLRKHTAQLSEGCRKEELHLMVMQAQDVRLRPKLRKLCSQAIAVYCAHVKPGGGRIMKCLQENLMQPDFGLQCFWQVKNMMWEADQHDWHGDFGFAALCGQDIDTLCKDAQGQVHSRAAVTKCLLSQFDALGADCGIAVSHAARLALWEYTPGAALTEACDLDVSRVCEAEAGRHKRGVYTIGAVGRCLARNLAKGSPLAAECRELIMAAAPEDARSQLTAGTAQRAVQVKIAELQAKAHAAVAANAALVKARMVNPEAPGAGVITISGWIAAAAMAAMVMVAIIGAYAGIRRLLSPRRPYTVVASRDADE